MIRVTVEGLRPSIFAMDRACADGDDARYFSLQPHDVTGSLSQDLAVRDGEPIALAGKRRWTANVVRDRCVGCVNGPAPSIFRRTAASGRFATNRQTNGTLLPPVTRIRPMSIRAGAIPNRIGGGQFWK